MRESIRCCIACILPCGALDVIRIVHSSGRVEEITRSVCAREILQAYPKHVLRTPPSFDEDGPVGCVPHRAVEVPPTAELQKGKIYFLMPVSSAPSMPPARQRRRRRKKVEEERGRNSSDSNNSSTNVAALAATAEEDLYLTEILSEKAESTQWERRRGRSGVWRPHLESISEITGDL